jgi:nucleoid-associated protein YgaU
METYVIQYEDTLEKIAEKRLGNKKRWYEIARINNIESPYIVFIGQTRRKK